MEKAVLCTLSGDSLEGERSEIENQQHKDAEKRDY